MLEPDHMTPIPVPTLLTKPFWEACRQHRLIIQRCDLCKRLRFYPSSCCVYCSSADYSWKQVSGRGKVYTWIVTWRTVDSRWKKKTPFVTAVVEIDEQDGVLIPGLLTEISPDDVKAGMAVEVWFEDANPDISLPRWRPVEAST